MKDQSWADHAVALLCWDMIMNQWSTVFYLYYTFITKKLTLISFILPPRPLSISIQFDSKPFFELFSFKTQIFSSIFWFRPIFIFIHLSFILKKLTYKYWNIFNFSVPHFFVIFL